MEVDSNSVSKGLNEPVTEMAQGMFQQILELYVLPVIRERQERGEIETPFDLRGAQVIFFADDRKPVTRINSQVKAIAHFKPKSDTARNEGDPVLEDEVERLEGITLSEEDDPDCGHITLIRINNKWTMAWDCIYNKGLSKKYINAAEEFYQSADFSRTQGNRRSFVDNLFSAIELAAKAILLGTSDANFRRRTNHKAISSRFNRYSALGNVKLAHRDAFNELAGLRYDARYLEGDITISEEDATRYMDAVNEMIERAKTSSLAE